MKRGGIIISLIILLLSVLSLTVQSCSPKITRPVEKRENKVVEPVQEKKESKVEKPLQEKKTPVTYRIDQHIARKEYMEAIDLIREEIANGSSELTFSIEYSRSYNSLIENSKKEYKRGKFSKAGQELRHLIDNYPESDEVKGLMNESEAGLQKLLLSCSEKLMAKGLSQYRAGNIGNSINTWEKILRFDPGNEEASNAIETATIQLKNLKSLGKKKK